MRSMPFYRILYIVALGLMGFSALGQSSGSAWERCWLHTDKSFYVSGELVWYTLYLPSIVKDQPLKVRVTLYDPANRPIHSTFLATNGQTQVTGYYRIPYDQPPGQYSLLFTGFDGKRSQRLLLAHLPIYNDLVPLDAEITLAPDPDATAPAAAEPAALQLSVEPLPSGVLAPRQRVQLTVTAKDPLSGQPAAKAQVSVSITDAHITGAAALNASNWIPGPAMSLVTLAQLQNKLYYQGILRDSTGKPISSGLLGAWDVDLQQFYFTKAENDGRFVLILPDYKAAHQVQFMDTEHSQVSVELVHDTLRTPPPALVYTKGIIEYLELSRQRKKIYQLYTALEQEVSIPEIPIKARTFTPDRSLRFADYTTFPSLAMFFQEVTNNVRFAKRRDGYYVRIYNQQLDADFPNEPFFLVDGKITRDLPYIASLKPAELERVDIFSKPGQLRDYFPGLGGSGVILVRSLTGKLPLPPAEENQIFLLSGLNPDISFPALSPDKPALRPLVYWQGALHTDANGRALLEFETTDDRSSFRIDLRGQNAKGELGAGSALFEVK